MIPIDLSGRSALVTGAASGIGRATAVRLAQAGASVFGLDVNEAGLNELGSEIPGVTPLPCDLTDAGAVDRAVATAESSGPLHALVHCAGIISYRKGIGAVSEAEWEKVLRVNLGSAFTLCRRAIEPMKESGGGSIVLFSSLAAEVGGIEVGIHYAASKAGLIGFVRTLAKEGAPHGVRVNAVAPGIVATGPVLAQVADHEESYRESIPLGRIGEPDEIADAVLFLCADLSRYVTGTTLDVNGGLYMG